MNADADRGVPLGEFAAQRRSARDEGFDPASKTRADFRKYQLVRQLPAQRCWSASGKNLWLIFAADRDRPVEDGAFGKAGGFVLSLRIDLFVDSGDGDEDGRLNFQQGRRQLLDEWAVGQGHAAIEQGKVQVPRGDVAKRQE